MTPGSHARPAQDGAARPHVAHRARRPWRLGTPLVVLLCGGLFVVSANNSEGTDLRPGRYTDLASLVRNEAQDYEKLKIRVAALNAQVTTLTESVNDRQVNRYQAEIEQLQDPAGLSPRSGAGVTVTLSDAPEDVIKTTTEEANLLVVHQQDIQAVVNAMWKGGATAITIQGQRIVSTTGILCQGSNVQLQGVPYSQPYVISAIGDPTALTNSLDTDDYVELYRSQAADPDIAVGWAMQLDSTLTAPAYDGLLDLSYAAPLR